ncbi:MAG: hypothetical protein NMK33_04085 [Candidatus Cardinium sp.]|uniref:hypothetical protein n=1 Tax=Cardinium endosymbiont of Dermatophagoides farinae TaxID=2597823 RepID=UPI001181F1E5|nr:hypothetical protein [Cardinium endosymbiont of Dermatophagoides farinae]TSJ80618.1 hypothetical protein FPG78_00810 [Cardinium endosymbiont of Dermatophagoides farinae]UWW96610.1 MAG: hypothetical protein NMK33_04085 [Candidatus Cardinium sp.]
MISNILFLLSFITSCNGLSRSTCYNMNGQGLCKEGEYPYTYVFNEDEYKDKDIFNATALKEFQLWYSRLMFNVKNPEIVILDLYNCIDQYRKLPLVGPIGALAAHKTLEPWKQGK